jgi:hypothetical protein
MNNFRNKTYRVSTKTDSDEITIDKESSSDWTWFFMKTNEEPNGQIIIRSKSQLENLHHLIGQLLENA